MSLKWISEAWRNNLKTAVTQEHRVYFNFRQREYPSVIEQSVEFTVVSAAANVPGSHYLSNGKITYLLDLPSKFTIDLTVRPTFAYNTGSDQALCAWWTTASHYFSVVYDQGGDNYRVVYIDGAAGKLLTSPAYTTSASFNVWTRITCSTDLSVATTTGTVFYIDGSVADSVWSSDIEVKTSNFPKFQLCYRATTMTGAFEIGDVRFFASTTASAGDVANNFRNIKAEEVFFPFNGTTLGHTRCNVSKQVSALGLRRARNSIGGNGSPSEARVELMSPLGQFSDDTYSDFDPANEYYNGTSSQVFLQAAVPMEIETWYASTFECEFTGRVDNNYFSRAVTTGDITRLGVSATDKISEIASKVKRKATYYENKKLSDTTESNSLVHLIGRLATETEWYNFLGNSGFEVTATNSWVTWGTGVTAVKMAGGLLGSARIDVIGNGGSGGFYQTVTFEGDKKLVPGQRWNASIYGKTATATDAYLYLQERTASAVLIESYRVTTAFAADVNWQKCEVTADISTVATAALRFLVQPITTTTLSVDCAMLVQNNRALDWFINCVSEGTAGVFDADDAEASAYDTVGFDADAVDITHPWALVPQEEPILGHLLDIGTATCARRLNVDPCGTLVYRSPLTAGYADPDTILTATSVVDMTSMIEAQQGNKLIVHGVDIVKTEKAVKIWDAEGSGFPSTSAHAVCVSVLSSATFPENVKSATFWMEWLT